MNYFSIMVSKRIKESEGGVDEDDKGKGAGPSGVSERVGGTRGGVCIKRCVSVSSTSQRIVTAMDLPHPTALMKVTY